MSNNFKQVYLVNGTYNTNRYGTGTTVSTDNLYVIDGKLGAFLIAMAVFIQEMSMVIIMKF